MVALADRCLSESGLQCRHQPRRTQHRGCVAVLLPARQRQGHGLWRQASRPPRHPEGALHGTDGTGLFDRAAVSSSAVILALMDPRTSNVRSSSVLPIWLRKVVCASRSLAERCVDAVGGTPCIDHLHVEHGVDPHGDVIAAYAILFRDIHRLVLEVVLIGRAFKEVMSKCHLDRRVPAALLLIWLRPACRAGCRASEVLMPMWKWMDPSERKVCVASIIGHIRFVWISARRSAICAPVQLLGRSGSASGVYLGQCR
jgi:hypothetical protein